MSAKEILVTGGAGYIGSQAVLDLVAAGWKPVVLDNFSCGRREIAEKLSVPVYEGDTRDSSRLDKVFSSHSFVAVMHFAALAQVGESVAHPERYYENNVWGTLALLQAMVRHGVKNFIFSSTCATYGEPEVVPMSEALPQKPINPYGHSKLMVERILRDMYSAHGVCSVSFRYFNAAGAHPEGIVGECHDPETHLIPLVIGAATGRNTLKVFGDNYPTPDGTCIRDYIHVADIAQAHILGLEWLQQGGGIEFFNIGSGSGFSVFEVIRAVEALAGKKVPYEIGARRPGDPPALVADATKLQETLGWKPEYPELERIVDTAWRWHTT